MSGEFFKVDNAVLTEYARKVEPTGVAIYCLLKSMANREHECWPSLDTIHNVLGVAKGTALKYLGKLEAFGLIQKRPEPKDGRRLRYRVVPLAEIVSNLETKQAQIEQEIGSKSETVQNLNRSKICNEIGSKFEQKQDSGNKNIASPSGKQSTGAHEGAESGKPSKPKKAGHPQHLECYRWFESKLEGKDPAPAMNNTALSWMLANNYAVADIQKCFEYLRTDPWYADRTLAVNLTEVKKKIQPWIGRGRPERHNGSQRNPQAPGRGPQSYRQPGGGGVSVHGESYRQRAAEAESRYFGEDHRDPAG